MAMQAMTGLLRNDISDNLVLTNTVAEALSVLADGNHDYALLRIWWACLRLRN